MRSHYFLPVVSLFAILIGTTLAQDNRTSSAKEPDAWREITNAAPAVEARDATRVLFRDFGPVTKGTICRCTIRIVNPTNEAQEWYVRKSSCYSMLRGLEARFRMAKGADGYAATLKSMESNVIEIVVDTSRFEGASTGRVFLQVQTDKGWKEFTILISAYSDSTPVT